MLRRRITIAPLVASLALLMGSLTSSADAAEQGAAPVEGESFPKPAGTQVVLGDQYSGGKALKITSSKALPTKQVTITETSKVLVRAHAGQRGGSPTLSIRVDGENAGTRRITSNVHSEYLYSGINLQPGTYKIGLKGGDLAQGRNVFVDVVSFPAVEPPLDTTAPETTITAGPEQHSTSQNESATFEFTSSEPNSTFECKITSQSFGQGIKGDDVGFWHPCTSPTTYSPLRDDNITFQVRAIDAAGNVDSTPAERIFTVQRPGPSLQITNGPADRSTINADSVTFEWTTDGVTPVDSYCQFRGPSGWVELFNSCSSPKTYQLTEDGYYVFNVFVEDATGNSTNMERQFAVDTSTQPDLGPDRIVFSTTRFDGTYQLATMNSDGSDVQPIPSTTGPPQEFAPAISPDRRSIAYVTDGNELGVVNVDGTNSTLLPPPPAGADRGFPDWSPDGKTIIYRQGSPAGSGSAIMRYPGEDVVIDLPGYDLIAAWGSNNRIVWANSQQGILSANPDGSDVVVLDSAVGYVNEPEVSPDGTKVLYFNNGEIWTMDANGSNKQNLTQDFSPLGGLPAWSSDGSQITFTAEQDIWVMNADGSNTHNVTNTPPGLLGEDGYADWGVSPAS